MNPADQIAQAREALRAAERDLNAALKGNDSRSRAPINRMLHEVRGMLMPGYPYASQAGQDRVIDRLLQGKRDGVFLDIGAYDGVTGSNTLYFEKWRGWTGVMVEPVATFRVTAEEVRSAPCLPYAVAHEAGEASFMAVTEGYTQMSGLVSSYDTALLEQVRADPRHREEMITVETRTIQGIFQEADLTRADFVSLDIEGGELAALECFPFEDYPVKTWAIENNTGGPEIAGLMREKGYQLVEFCGPDEIYIHPGF